MVKTVSLFLLAGMSIALWAGHSTVFDTTPVNAQMLIDALRAPRLTVAGSMLMGQSPAQAAKEVGSMVVLATGLFCAASFLRRRREP